MTTSPTERWRVLSRSTERVKRPAVRAETDTATRAKVYLYDVIDSWGGPFGISAREFVDELNALGSIDEIELHINSPGGDVYEGIAIRNALRQHEARITTVVDGLAASAASFIAVAGEDVVMAANSELMVHNAWGICIGNAVDLRDLADRLDHHDSNIAAMYATKAGGEVADWLAVMGDETWFSAAEAVEAGLADRTDTADSPADSEAAKDRYDLSIFNHAGRSHAPAPKPPTASADGFITQEGSSAVAFSTEQITSMRQELGLPEDADEATIVAALSEALAEQTEESTSTTTTAPDGMTLVEADVLQSLRDQAGQGVAARQQQLDEHRDRTIARAVTDGKITPARRDHWATSWDSDAEGAEQTLAALAPGLVPVEERGHDQSTVANSAYDELYGNQQKEA